MTLPTNRTPYGREVHLIFETRAIHLRGWNVEEVAQIVQILHNAGMLCEDPETWCEEEP